MVTHQVHDVAVERKRDALTYILKHGTSHTLVFCRTKRGANRVGEDLGQRGMRTGVIHGNKSQDARSRMPDDFEAGRVRVLVLTDIAARVSTSRTCRWSSTSICRSRPRTTSIASAARAAAGNTGVRCRCCRRQRSGCCGRFSEWCRRRWNAWRFPTSRRKQAGDQFCGRPRAAGPQVRFRIGS